MGLIIYVAVYLGACVLIAKLGDERKFGFWGYFFSSVLLSPLVGFVLLLASDRRKVVVGPCPTCGARPIPAAPVEGTVGDL